MKLQSGMGVMGWLTRPYSIPYSIGLPYLYTTPSNTRPTSTAEYFQLESFCISLSLLPFAYFEYLESKLFFVSKGRVPYALD